MQYTEIYNFCKANIDLKRPKYISNKLLEADFNKMYNLHQFKMQFQTSVY